MSESPPFGVRYLAPSQVAELLSVSVDEVMELVHDGRLRGARLGSPAKWRIEEESLRGYIADQVEEARQMHLWEQSQAASFPEVWNRGAPGRPE
ncbi:helix-turn-helix domain-containing protein [Microbacterium sp. LRZ72]|uniref:helix-turn-helix domain-containing protein n=1 Tax=Microbacterium sp. LRZ72 TaxID=2942481 RepID=UPI0029B921E4|nr:helix-turn-helix domain-containing protein [Microbacterium sp. LRZ72]MDX2377066.1 helix-turn-helix domain-containing protein [Microbacterium sp. LRZ72]